MAREFFCAYHSYLGIAEKMSDRNLARLCRAALRYSASGEEDASLPRTVQPVFAVLRAQIDRDREKYEATCARNREKARGYWEGVRGEGRDGCRRIPAHAGAYQDKDEDEDKDKKEYTPLYPPEGERERPRRRRRTKVDPQYTNEALAKLEIDLSAP